MRLPTPVLHLICARRLDPTSPDLSSPLHLEVRANLCVKRKQEGFTLVEMLVASLILTVGTVSLMSMVLFALASRYASRIDSAALRLSQKKMEELKSLSLNDPVLSISGNSLSGDGRIDFSSAPSPVATVTSQLVLNKTRDTRLSFETRWNVTTVNSKKIITVATRKNGGAPTGLEPVNLKIVMAR